MSVKPLEPDRDPVRMMVVAPSESRRQRASGTGDGGEKTPMKVIIIQDRKQSHH